ncbi:hypothetical protein DHEL01_v200517 [Diaporthe helianthi]|uniref:Uncharacterized protein n=1 Tax=Diaporthe helianthi TaxID=158607 RepID=A0A2P5IF16_DIAHE|nr:hypothetical protein DHEL01_v200517 [Diaporthe helianthi]
MSLTPLILSPALPSELLTYIIRRHEYPTTLIVCSSQAEFLESLLSDAQKALPAAGENGQESALSSLLSSPLYQVAITRHIRIIFVPTVSHLRACLSVFNTKDSKVPPPPVPANPGRARTPPLLLVYGFLAMHRDTSEWSAQGISSTAANLVETATRVGLRAVIVDPPQVVMQSEDGAEAPGPGAGDGLLGTGMEQTTLSEEVPVLSASARRAGAHLDNADWTGRTVTVARVLGRWFRYRQGDWAQGVQEHT